MLRDVPIEEDDSTTTTVHGVDKTWIFAPELLDKLDAVITILKKIEHHLYEATDTELKDEDV